jgi:hypothetical protein
LYFKIHKRYVFLELGDLKRALFTTDPTSSLFLLLLEYDDFNKLYFAELTK